MTRFSLAQMERDGVQIIDLPPDERAAFEREQAAICDGLKRGASAAAARVRAVQDQEPETA